MFFELRQYRIQPGQRAAWVTMMEETIIPFQVARGMVVCGSFVAEDEGDDLYVWIRRFAGEEERAALYAAVYETDEWKNTIAPRVGELIDRSRTVVSRIVPTPKSVLQ